MLLPSPTFPSAQEINMDQPEDGVATKVLRRAMVSKVGFSQPKLNQAFH